MNHKKLKTAVISVGVFSAIGLLGYASSQGCFNSSSSRYPIPVVAPSKLDAGVEDSDEDTNQYDASTSATARSDGGIRFTVLDLKMDAGVPSPLPEVPAAPPSFVDPQEALLTRAQDYVTQHSWKEILQQYAGVPGGIIVSIQDYQGNDKAQACRLALGRLVETTIGSVADRTHQKYKELADLIIRKGLNDCMENVRLDGCRNYDAQGHLTRNTQCYLVRFGL